MAYLSLYRKYRSQGFDEILGQRHVTQTLTNALERGAVVHAYLFTGPRGTGKTSTARVLAKALNCLASDGPTPNPCGVCEACVRIRDGSSLDVTEIDAASNRGIDDIRDLREGVKYAPAQERIKVYVIDEVHQLTPESFNALLKTLEEPPPNVVFVLATTELHKLPATILSRCQRFDFRRGSLGDLRERITTVCEAEGWEISPEAVNAIALGANGGYRDALGLLEQVAAFTGGEPIGLEAVNATMGGVPDERLLDIVDALSSGNAGDCFRLVDEALASGVEVRQFLTSLRGRARDLLVMAVGAPPEEVSALPAHAERIRAQAKALPVADLLWFVNELAEAERDLRWASHPRLLLETTLVRLATRSRPEPAAPPAAAPRTMPAPAPATTPARPAPRAPRPSSPPPAAPDMAMEVAPDDGTSADEPDLRVYQNAWSELLRGVKGGTRALLADSKPIRMERGMLVVNIPNEFSVQKVNDKRDVTEGIIARIVGHKVVLKFVSESGPQPVSAKPAGRGRQDSTPGPAPVEAGSLESLAADVFGGELVGDDSDNGG